MVDIKNTGSQAPSQSYSVRLSGVWPGVWGCNMIPGDSGKWPGLETSAQDTASSHWRGFKGYPQPTRVWCFSYPWGARGPQRGMTRPGPSSGAPSPCGLGCLRGLSPCTSCHHSWRPPGPAD